MLKRVIAVSIVVEVIVVFILAFRLVASTIINSKISINPLPREDLSFSPTKELKYFYEISHTGKPSIKDPFDATYNINKDNLNERFDYKIAKEKGVFRIITVGDSWTQGLYVDTKNNWTEVLEDRLNSEFSCLNIDKFEVINLGVQGYDTQFEVERYKRRGVKYNPDLVVWFVIDLKRDNERLMPLIDKYYQDMKNNSKESFGITQENEKYGDWLKGYFYWKKAWDEINGQINYDQMLALQKKSFGSFYALYKGKIVFMASPKFKDKEINFLKDLAKEKDNFLFDKLKDIEHFSIDNHPNEKGHQQIANQLLSYLHDNKVIPCEVKP